MATNKVDVEPSIFAIQELDLPTYSDLRRRITELEAALRHARGAIWELHNWTDRVQFNRDPAVKAINAALGEQPQATDGLPLMPPRVTGSAVMEMVNEDGMTPSQLRIKELETLLAEAYAALLHANRMNYPWQAGSIASRVLRKAEAAEVVDAQLGIIRA